MKKNNTHARLKILIAFALSFLLISSFGFASQQPAPLITDKQAILNRIHEPFKGDLDDIRKRRFIRVLVSYCKTNYFFDQGKPRGFEYELMKAYERFLNKKREKPIRQNQNDLRSCAVQSNSPGFEQWAGRHRRSKPHHYA